MNAEQNKGRGIIYVLVNDAMPGYVKIGITRNIEERIRSLDNTNMPLPFSCFFAAEIERADFVERQIHDAFGDHRVRSNREFFRLSPERAVSAIMVAPYKDVTPGKDFVETEEDQRALDKARQRKSVFRFSLVGIPVGATLKFTRDPNIICIVVDDRKVSFEGEMVSLSSAADLALRKVGIAWKSVQGPVYWEYDGETLDEMRTRIEEEGEEEEREPTQGEIDDAGDKWMNRDREDETGLEI
ncbi:MAG: GIY-YIG nuclease family protein [Candidatus Paceibacterota bacterium]|jgi:hypothetical protein